MHPPSWHGYSTSAVAERLDLPLTGGDKYWNEYDLAVEFYLFR